MLELYGSTSGTAEASFQKKGIKVLSWLGWNGVPIGRKAGGGIPMLAAVRQWNNQYESAVDSDEGVFGR